LSVKRHETSLRHNVGKRRFIETIGGGVNARGRSSRLCMYSVLLAW
jgi:hypothetical protein